MLQATHFLYETGLNLFYFDFRRSGESGGVVSSIGCLETRDLEAAIEDGAEECRTDLAHAAADAFDRPIANDDQARRSRSRG
jgi:alpha/beta superfamily hydrolase